MLRQFRSHAGDETDQPSEWDGQQEEHQRKEGHRDHRRQVQNRKPEPTEHQHPELMEQIDAKGVGTGGFVKRIATETRNFINRFKPTSISASFPG